MRYSVKEFTGYRVALALMMALALLSGCHGGAGTSSDDGGGDDTTPPSMEFGAAKGVRDGVIIEFSEPMDTASVEANVHLLQGDYTEPSADISKAIPDGTELDFSAIWSGNTIVRIRWPARYGVFYTIIVDTGAMTEAGVNLSQRIVQAAEVDDNPYDFDGLDNMADVDVPDFFVVDKEANPLPTFLVLDHEDLLLLTQKSYYLTLGDIEDLTELWHFSDADTGYSTRKMGRVDGGNAVVASTSKDVGYVTLFRHDPVDEETGMGEPSMVIGTDMGKIFGYVPLGDLNADGYVDFMFAAGKKDDGIGGYLVQGAADFFDRHGSMPLTDASLYSAAVETTAAESFSFCSFRGASSSLSPRVVADGNFDGDGYGDYALCYYYAGSAAKAPAPAPSGMATIHIYHGADPLPADLFGTNTIINMEAESGFTVGGVVAADINGDLVDDILLPYQNRFGESKAAALPYESGVLVFFGEKDVRSDMIVPTDADADIKIDSATDIIAKNLGDIDADGYEDFGLVISDTDPESGDPTSRILFMKGRAAWEETVDAEALAVDCASMGEYSLCTNMSAAGDVDNDGYDDVGIWIREDDGSSNSQSYVLLGGGRNAGEGEITDFNIMNFKIMAMIMYDYNE